MNHSRPRLMLSALVGFLAILLGSLGAHGPVHEVIKAAGELEHWATATDYHLPHSVALLVLALWGDRGGRVGAWAWGLLFAGVLLFCGSLYLLAFTQVKWLAHLAPFGGVCLMLGWLSLLLISGPSSQSSSK